MSNLLLFFLGGAQIRSVDISLPPLGSLDVSHTWIAVVGNHTITATVDPNDEIPESNEEDNSLNLTITVATAAFAGFVDDSTFLERKRFTYFSEEDTKS